MAQSQNVKAAELHGAAAKSHQMAADLHNKDNAGSALDHATKAMRPLAKRTRRQ